jgi:DNA-nicking Smr family endonuclease
MGSRKKKTAEQKPRPVEFHNNPFSALKGIETKTDEKPPEPAAKIKPPAKPDPDDASVFFEAMHGVRPLLPTPPASGKKQPSGPKPEMITKKPVQPAEEDNAGHLFLQEVKKLKLDVHFKDSIPGEDDLQPMDGNRLRQIKRGIININRQLDLHGLTREEALESLQQFLGSARASGEKAALVITGKGYHSLAGPVLQQAVAAWLRDQGRKLVLEFAPAPNELGGTGAFVVFLRPLDKPALE